MNFLNDLNKKLNNKYSYLKLLRVVYNTTFSTCMVNFIYPESSPILTEIQKDEIKLAVGEILGIKGKLDCKFNKSYLDKDIVFAKLFEFIKSKYDSISPYFTNETLTYERDLLCVKITISANKTLAKYIDNNNVIGEILNFLNNNFCGDFNLTCNLNADEFDTSFLNDRAISMQCNIKVEARAPRYKVTEPMMVFGSEIIPSPEYIKNLKGEKTSVILAGTVCDLTEKEYLPRKNKEKGIDEKRKYYTFKLDDESGKINAIHFCTKISEKHFKLIENGSYIVCKGDCLKKQAGDLQYMIKSIGLCNKIKDEPEVKDSVVVEDMYKFARPVPYTRTIQHNLFEVKKEYPDYIKDKTYVVFDVETTGLDADKNDITEIGAVKIINGEIVEKFQTLCKPFEQIPDKIIQLTGITNEMVENMPSSSDVIDDFLLFAKDSVLVGYNVNFDLNFIQNVAKRRNKLFTNETRDCLIDARAKLSLPNYKLGTLVAHLGITLDNAHRALYDATATAEAFLALSLS